MRTGFIPALLLAAAAWSAPPVVEAQRVELVRVLDGDTLVVELDGAEVAVRLPGVDCPELDQPYGPEAAAAVRRRLAGAELALSGRSRRSYGRRVQAVEFLLRRGGGDLGTWLVVEGWAWQDPRYSRDAGLAAAEARARAAGKGLWAGADPVPPWSWRRGARPQIAAAPLESAALTSPAREESRSCPDCSRFWFWWWRRR